MKNIRFLTSFPRVWWSVSSLFALMSFNLLAHISIVNAQVRLLPSIITNTSAYFMLENDTTQPLILVAASSPASEKVEIHNHVQENGIMKMVHVTSVTVRAGETLTLQPGGYHLMLFGLKKPLKKGQMIPITLTTKSSFTIAIEAEVTNTIAKHHH